MAVRYNALAATLPLVVLLFEWREGWPWLKRGAIAAAAWLAVTAAVFAINDQLTDQKMSFWTTLAAYDIAGTLAHVDEDLPDAELERVFAGTDLLVHDHIHQAIRAVYTPRDALPVVSPGHPLWPLPVYGSTPAPPERIEAVQRAWREVLGRYPVAFVRHRLDVMAEVLSIYRFKAAVVVPRRVFNIPAYAYAQHVPTGWSRLQVWMTNKMSQLWRNVPIFLPWTYLLLALALLWPSRRDRAAFALLASGVVMEGSLLLLAPSPDYRYSHWLVICACVGAVLALARRRAARRSGAVARGGDDPALGRVAGEDPVDAAAPGPVA